MEKVEVTKYLWLYLDQNLNWKEHVESILCKLSKLEGAFYYLAHVIDQKCINQLYYAYVFPHIRYGIELYGVCDQATLKRLQVKQNKLLKILSRKKRRFSTNELHCELDLLKCADLHKYFTCIFVKKQQQQQLPTVFDQYYTKNHNVSRRSTRQSSDLYVPRFRTTGGQKSLKFIGAKLWNSLSINIKHEPSFVTFKGLLKSMLISLYKT